MTVAPPPNCLATGKRAYRSPKAAKEAHRQAGFRVRVFRCKHCGLYHVSHEQKDESA